VIFHGHPNVLCFHKKSIEITREPELSRRGDCIIGVKSDKGCSHLDHRLRHAIGRDEAEIRIEIVVGDLSLKISGRGNCDLSAIDKRDIVIRKSIFCCPRTLSVLCDKAAADIPSVMVKKLQDPATEGLLRITAE
jgi:hypothetical protein